MCMFLFLILFSSIITIRLVSCCSVTLAIKSTYLAFELIWTWRLYTHIMNDPEILNTIVRTSALPEELGRITHLLSEDFDAKRSGDEDAWGPCPMEPIPWMKHLISFWSPSEH